jgi:hypothetical protein
MFNTMPAGDTVALCRTGAWSGAVPARNSNCRAASGSWPPPVGDVNTCDFRDYVPSWASGSSPRPIIHGTAGATVFDFSTSTQGYRVWNLDIRHDGGGNGTIFLYRNVNHLDFCNLSLDGQAAPGGLAVYATMPPVTAVAVRNSQFYRYGFSAFLGGAHDLLLDSNYFENNGTGNSPQQHTLYVITSASLGGVSTRMKVINNEIRTDARCGGVMLVVHGRVTDLTIENNHLATTSTNGNCYGIQAAGSAESGQFVNLVVRRNRLFLSGQTGIEASACVNCIVSDNIVSGGSGISVNVSCRSGMEMPAGPATIQNNSVYKGMIAVGCDGNGYVIENNAVWTTGTCYDIKRPTLRYDGNYCRTSGGVPAESVWVDVLKGNFMPASPGPLIGAASQRSYSPTAIGTVAWSPTDRGRARVPPIDIGAHQR